MEKITFNYNSSDKKKTVKLRYRLRDGRSVQICHTSDLTAVVSDLDKFEPTGIPKGRISVYNTQLSSDLKREYDAMVTAYALMCDQGLDITTEVFEREIRNILNPIEQVRSDNPSVVDRFRKYARDAERTGIIGPNRCKHILVVSDKLDRFLKINGISAITPQEFSEEHLMDFRNFIFDEYNYVEKYPKLYKSVKKQNLPEERLSMNTVASQMKMLQTFFNELENTDEIHKSPFRKLGKEKKKAVMKTLYDEPYFLRKDELLKLVSAEVPDSMQEIKDAFLLQCALGSRVSDFAAMSMDSVSVSEEGIPYIHYIPHKTVGSLSSNEEIRTPLVRFAFDIVKRTGFSFPILNNLYGHSGYNAQIKCLLRIAKINREVAQFNEETKKNDYVPLCSVASSKLCRKTHVDMMNKVQIDIYAAGLHKTGSSAVNRYTMLEIKDRFTLMNHAFGQKPFKVNDKLEIIGR